MTAMSQSRLGGLESYTNLFRAYMTSYDVWPPGVSGWLTQLSIWREHLIPVKKPGGRGIYQIFSRTKRVSAMIENKRMRSTDRLRASPRPHRVRGHPDLRRGFPNPSHAGEARWSPNCSAEARNWIQYVINMFTELGPDSNQYFGACVLRYVGVWGVGGKGGGGLFWILFRILFTVFMLKYSKYSIQWY